MRLYNTLPRKLEQLKPINDRQVKLYSCGPTVYDFPHLGNLRAFVFVDSLRRALLVSDYVVKHVMNITDVGHLVSDADEGEDKLESGAKRDSKSVWEVANFYYKVFKDNAAKLNLLTPNAYSKDGEPYALATDFIPQQIEIVKLLLQKGFAYQTKQAIYFDVSKLPSYGELSGQKLSQKEIGARPEVVTDPDKKHPQDFGLWFFLVGRFAAHQMHWASPWGEGFPGWHLECSAIIHATLGEPIDIHTGGVDHIGTHHPNEMAQTEAAFGHRLANIWLHNQFLLVEGERMAKSAGNFYTLDDVAGRGFEPLALRLLFLQSHYRSQMNFTWDSLVGASSRLQAFRAAAALMWQPKDVKQRGEATFTKAKAETLNSLSEDLNTPQALAVLDAFFDQLRAASLNKADLESFRQFLIFCDNALGLDLGKEMDITAEQKQLIAERERYRDSADWSEADALRQRLLEQGLEINDTPAGAVWSRNHSS